MFPQTHLKQVLKSFINPTSLDSFLFKPFYLDFKEYVDEINDQNNFMPIGQFQNFWALFLLGVNLSFHVFKSIFPVKSEIQVA